MGHAVFVLGAAGSGKTTFCKSLKERGGHSRNIKLINMDPAQMDGSSYDVDLCEYITVDDVMEECDFGPNGALFHALEEMCGNIDELHLHDFENEYFLFDCPGQIELFLHSDIIDRCIKHVQSFSKVAVLYLIDSTNFMTDDKHMYSALCATITAGRLYVPVLCLLTKCDLIEDEALENILLQEEMEHERNEEDEYSRLQNAISDYINFNGFVSYLPLDWKKEEYIENILIQLDNVLQRYDDIEPREKPQQE